VSIRHGGLMRCCLLTLDDYLAAGGTEKSGTVLPCAYCRSSMIVAADGVWEWNRQDAKPDAR